MLSLRKIVKRKLPRLKFEHSEFDTVFHLELACDRRLYMRRHKKVRELRTILLLVPLEIRQVLNS